MAKYISENSGVQVVICDCPGPRINLKDKRIELPEKIKEQNAFAALSSLMHEAAHLKYSVIIPEDFAKDNIDHHIVNALEDIRIDRKNFNLLPNIYSFYKVSIKEHVCTKQNKSNIDKQHLFVRTMIQMILLMTYFGKYCWDQESIKLVIKHDLQAIFEMGVSDIENKRWSNLRKTVDKIKAIFFPPQKKEEKKDKGKGKGKGECKDSDKGDAVDGKGEGADGKGKGTGNKSIGKDDIDKLMKPTSVWDKGDGLKGETGKGFSSIQLTETTKNKLKECLNIKEKHIVDDGSELNTDNLIAFYTGDTEELFKEETTEQVKKSKIVFCLDASGSMRAKMVDNKRRKQVLGDSIQAMIDVLDDVRASDGLDVDYDVVGFTQSPRLLNKETWRQDYQKMSGGTNIFGAVRRGIEILSENDIEGSKLIILVTDGEVQKEQSKSVEDLIMKKNSDIKAMLIGIDVPVGGYFAKNLCGDNNIVCMDHAEEIIMEALQTMLEGS